MSNTKQSIYTLRETPPEGKAEGKDRLPRRWRIKPWVFGIAAGILFVLLEVVFNLYPPSAYGFCLSCHTRDLISTIVNRLAGTSWGATILSGRVLMLTSPAVIAGALLTAHFFRETRFKRAEKPLRSFIYGFIIMTAGIVIFGCPTRLLLRAGYGDIYALGGVVFMYAGVTLATVIMRFRITRRTGS